MWIVYPRSLLVQSSLTHLRTVSRITEIRQAMSRKTPNGPSRPDKNAERDAKGLQKKARLENDLEEGLEESFPASDPPSASEPGI